MFIGHVGVALAAKRVAPRVSLGTLLVAATLLDGVWALLCPIGFDTSGIAPVLMTAVRPDFGTDSISHSVPFCLALALLFGLGYLAIRRNGPGALVIGGLVLSHPILDLPGRFTHVMLWPGTAPGVPLRGPVPILLLAESALLLCGLIVYLRTTRARDRIGSWGLGSSLVVQLLLFAAAIYPPNPLEVQALALATFGTFCFAPLAFWIDRHRGPTFPETPEFLAARLGSRSLALSMFL